MFKTLNYSKQYQQKLIEERIERLSEEIGDLFYNLTECKTYNELDKIETNIRIRLDILVKTKEAQIKQGN